MSTDLKGQMFALMTAVCWSSAMVMFKRTGESVPPLALNLFKNAIGLVLLLTTVVVQAGVQSASGEPTAFASLPTGNVTILLISGVLGIAVADSLFFYALNMLGVGLTALVECLYSPFTLLCAYLWLGETLTLIHVAGGLLILTGIIICSRTRLPVDRTPGQIAAGILLGATAMATMAFAITWAKRPIEQTPLFVATALRLLGGTLALSGIMALPAHRRTIIAAFTPSRVWRVSVPASVLATYFCLIFWVAGFKYTLAWKAAVLNQTASIMAVVLAAVFLKEALTLRKVIAFVLAMSGVAIIVLSDRSPPAREVDPVAAAVLPETVVKKQAACHSHRREGGCRRTAEAACACVVLAGPIRSGWQEEQFGLPAGSYFCVPAAVGPVHRGGRSVSS